MKRVLFIIMAILTVASANGQKIRFSDSTNTWKMYVLSCCDPPYFVPQSSNYTISYYGDSVIGGHTYKKMLGSPALIREDTIAQKVYIRLNDVFADSSELVLYDYNWHVGDTVRQPSYGGYGSVSWVIGIDSTMINSIWYKVWHFQGTGFNYYVIEGVGCTNKFDYAIRPYPYFEHSEQLTCFTNRGASYPLSLPVVAWGLLGDLYFDNAASCDISLKIDDTTLVSNIAEYPNPTDRSLTISAQFPITNVTISDLLGQIVFCRQYSANNVHIDVSSLPLGVYLVRINGIEVRRFVKQ